MLTAKVCRIAFYLFLSRCLLSHRDQAQYFSNWLVFQKVVIFWSRQELSSYSWLRTLKKIEIFEVHSFWSYALSSAEDTQHFLANVLRTSLLCVFAPFYICIYAQCLLYQLFSQDIFVCLLHVLCVSWFYSHFSIWPILCQHSIAPAPRDVALRFSIVKVESEYCDCSYSVCSNYPFYTHNLMN